MFGAWVLRIVMSEPSNGRFKFLARLFAWDVLLDLETARNQQSSYLQGPILRLQMMPTSLQSKERHQNS